MVLRRKSEMNRQETIMNVSAMDLPRIERAVREILAAIAKTRRDGLGRPPSVSPGCTARFLPACMSPLRIPSKCFMKRIYEMILWATYLLFDV